MYKIGLTDNIVENIFVSRTNLTTSKTKLPKLILHESGRVPGEGISQMKQERLDKTGKLRKTYRPIKNRIKCPIYMPRSEANLFKSKGLQLIELLGEGSYSKVYLCKKQLVSSQEDQLTSNTSAVLAMKIVDTTKISSEFIQKFLPRELSVLVKINHPNIIKLYLLFQRKCKYYMCMRYAERGDLLEYILSHGLITENRARFWTKQLGTALEYLHTMNVVHRDIKTENVLITECFNVKLCDFGFSRFIADEDLSSTYCGSISYSPPEVLQVKPYDAKKGDMWSLGVVIFVMLVKRLPFSETENPKLLLIEQIKKSYLMPQKIEEILSMQSKKTLKRLLEPNAKKRWGIQELLKSPWLSMDFRLAYKSKKEGDAINEAVEIAANRAGRNWTEMVQKQETNIIQALNNAETQSPKSTEIWKSTDRLDYKIGVTSKKIDPYPMKKSRGAYIRERKRKTDILSDKDHADFRLPSEGYDVEDIRQQRLLTREEMKKWNRRRGIRIDSIGSTKEEEILEKLKQIDYDIHKRELQFRRKQIQEERKKSKLEEWHSFKEDDEGDEADGEQERDLTGRKRYTGFHKWWRRYILRKDRPSIQSLQLKK